MEKESETIPRAKVFQYTMDMEQGLFEALKDHQVAMRLKEIPPHKFHEIVFVETTWLKDKIAIE